MLVLVIQSFQSSKRKNIPVFDCTCVNVRLTSVNAMKKTSYVPSFYSNYNIENILSDVQFYFAHSIISLVELYYLLNYFIRNIYIIFNILSIKLYYLIIYIIFNILSIKLYYLIIYIIFNIIFIKLHY